MENGLSQLKMAELLGVTQGHYSKVEKGTADLSGPLLRKITSLMGVDSNMLHVNGDIPDFELAEIQYMYENLLYDSMNDKIKELLNTYKDLSLFNDKMLKLRVWESMLSVELQQESTAINVLRLIEEPVNIFGELNTKIMYNIAYGYAWARVGQFDKAMNLFSQAHQMLNRMEPREEVHLRLQTLWQMASVCAQQGKTDDARRYLKDCEKVIDAEFNDLVAGKSATIYSIANLLASRGHNLEAIKPFLETISLDKSINAIQPQINAYNNIGVCYERMGNLEMAHKYYRITYSLGKMFPEHLFWEVKEALERDGYIF